MRLLDGRRVFCIGGDDFSMSLFYYIATSRELPTGSLGKSFKRMTMKDYLVNVNPDAKVQTQIQILMEKYPEGDRFVRNI